MINSKEQIIKYFESGIKNKKNFKIGIEHEKFLFNKNNDKNTIKNRTHNYLRSQLKI